MRTFFPNLVFIVFDVCNTIPDAGHNQADATMQMWKQFSPFANEFMIQLIAANCLIFFFVSPQAFRESGACEIGTVISEKTFSQKATLLKVAVDDKVVIFGQSPIHMGHAAHCAASLVLKYSYLDLILTVLMATLKEGGMPITAQHVNQVKAEAKKLIDLRNTAGKASSMASFIVALHNTMHFSLVEEFGVENGTPKFLDWKHTWHTEVGKLSPSCKPKGSEEYKAWLKTTIEANPACQPDGSEEYKAWRDVTPQCQPDGSEEKDAWRDVTPQCQPEGSEEYEAWRKSLLESHQKRLAKIMAEPLPDTVVAARHAEAKRMAAKKSAATVFEENKSAQADLK